MLTSLLAPQASSGYTTYDRMKATCVVGILAGSIVASIYLLKQAHLAYSTPEAERTAHIRAAVATMGSAIAAGGIAWYLSPYWYGIAQPLTHPAVAPQGVPLGLSMAHTYTLHELSDAVLIQAPNAPVHYDACAEAYIYARYVPYTYVQRLLQEWNNPPEAHGWKAQIIDMLAEPCIREAHFIQEQCTCAHTSAHGVKQEPRSWWKKLITHIVRTH